MLKKKAENVVFKCAVHLLEDLNVVEYEYLETHKGNYIIDQLCHQLKIREKYYFGMRYVDSGTQRQWLDLEKLITKQCKDVNPLIFSFRVKYYPADPFHLSTNARILLFKQLKRDLNHGRLYCSNDEFITLGALIVQEELGDYDGKLHSANYVSTFRVSIRQTDAIEKKIMNKYKGRKPGQEPSAVIDEFLEIARNLEAYGIEPHYVKDHHGNQLYIGVNYMGISAFISGKRSQLYRWNEIRKLNFEGRMFIVHSVYTNASRELV
ncbi:FERM domain-containing protein 5, partial [Rhagoletis pomonella]|uniref:FERM domain-containing protein 5 n=1 Tax=Rhagoletis pomonella TaxID=28610 RepID=UPI001786EBDB